MTINDLSQMLEAGVFAPYIEYIRFPKYKNLSKDLKIDFSYPITALVGANGTNKSSILRALYGAPDQQNLGNFWFSTSIDPIKEGDGNRNCFIYSYHNEVAQRSVEVLKSRIKRNKDPDYWETSKPVIAYGMEKMPELSEGDLPEGRKSTRWDAVKKEVTYIDFRASLSAYDKFFYHTDFKDNSLKQKKDRVRKYTPHLKKALDRSATVYSLYTKKNRILGGLNRELTEDERNEISNILGRKYSSIKLIRHSFYTSDAYTCLMSSKSLTYSEAFAGSGEFAVVKLVVDIYGCANKSLVLLDEPEVSLHPGAQDKLMEFLIKQVKIKQLQVVMSTHSPFIVKHLPENAIKVLQVDTDGMVCLSKQSSQHEEAFYHLGMVSSSKKTIVVEDKLACEIIKKVLASLGVSYVKNVDVKYFPGGSSVLWSNQVKTYAMEERDNLIVYFDGDCREVIPEEQSLPSSQNLRLKEIIKLFARCEIKFNPDTDSAGLIELQRGYIKWTHKYVKFFSCECSPEEWLWRVMPKDSFACTIEEEASFKKRFEQLTRNDLDRQSFMDVTGEEIFNFQKRMLAKVPISDDVLQDVATNIKRMFE